MKSHHAIATTVLGLAVALAAAGDAQSNLPKLPEPDAVGVIDDTKGGLPVVKEHDGIRYISGGVGSSEADAMNRMDDQYNLKLTMSVSSGQFTVPNLLRIEYRGGAEILEIVPNGPLFLAKLQPGDYVVQVNVAGKTLTRGVTVPASGQEAVALSWPGDQPSRTGDAPAPRPEPIP